MKYCPNNIRGPNGKNIKIHRTIIVIYLKKLGKQIVSSNFSLYITKRYVL